MSGGRVSEWGGQAEISAELRGSIGAALLEGGDKGGDLKTLEKNSLVSLYTRMQKR